MKVLEWANIISINLCECDNMVPISFFFFGEIGRLKQHKKGTDFPDGPRPMKITNPFCKAFSLL